MDDVPGPPSGGASSSGAAPETRAPATEAAAAIGGPHEYQHEPHGRPEWHIDVLYVASGLAVSWIVVDGVFAQIATFDRTQPEGLALATYLGAVSATANTVVVPWFEWSQATLGWPVRRWVLVMAWCQVGSCVLAAATWYVSVGGYSVFLYAVMFLSSIAGNGQQLALLPWLAETGEAHRIAKVMLGGSCGVVVTALFAWGQSAAGSLGGPSLFFVVLAVIVAASTLALHAAAELHPPQSSSSSSSSARDPRVDHDDGDHPGARVAVVVSCSTRDDDVVADDDDDDDVEAPSGGGGTSSHIRRRRQSPRGGSLEATHHHRIKSSSSSAEAAVQHNPLLPLADSERPPSLEVAAPSEDGPTGRADDASPLASRRPAPQGVVAQPSANTNNIPRRSDDDADDVEQPGLLLAVANTAHAKKTSASRLCCGPFLDFSGRHEAKSPKQQHRLGYGDVPPLHADDDDAPNSEPWRPRVNAIAWSNAYMQLVSWVFVRSAMPYAFKAVRPRSGGKDGGAYLSAAVNGSLVAAFCGAIVAYRTNADAPVAFVNATITIAFSGFFLALVSTDPPLASSAPAILLILAAVYVRGADGFCSPIWYRRIAELSGDPDLVKTAGGLAICVVMIGVWILFVFVATFLPS